MGASVVTSSVVTSSVVASSVGASVSGSVGASVSGSVGSAVASTVVSGSSGVVSQATNPTAVTPASRMAASAVRMRFFLFMIFLLILYCFFEQRVTVIERKDFKFGFVEEMQDTRRASSADTRYKI